MRQSGVVPGELDRIAISYRLAEEVVDIAISGSGIACVLSSEGRVSCYYHALGGEFIEQSGLGDDVTDVAAGMSYVCALSETDTVYCAGNFPVFGGPKRVVRREPLMWFPVGTLKGTRQLLSTRDRLCFVRGGHGEVFCIRSRGGGYWTRGPSTVFDRVAPASIERCTTAGVACWVSQDHSGYCASDLNTSWTTGRFGSFTGIQTRLGPLVSSLSCGYGRVCFAQDGVFRCVHVD